MISSIQPGMIAATTGTPSGGGLLQTQLNQLEVKLADWCHCPSGKTPDGQRKIADLQAKEDAIKAQLQQIDTARRSHSRSDTQSFDRSRLDVYA
jgi:hypothetical protein